MQVQYKRYHVATYLGEGLVQLAGPFTSEEKAKVTAEEYPCWQEVFVVEEITKEEMHCR